MIFTINYLHEFLQSHFIISLFAGAKQVTKPDVNPKNNDYDSKDTKACNIDKVLPNSQPFPNCDTTENTLAYPRKRTVSNNGSPDSKVMSWNQLFVMLYYYHFSVETEAW